MQNSRRLFPIFFSFFEFRPIEQAKYFCICLPNDRPIAVDISVGYFHICVDVVQCLVYGVFVDFERGRTGYRCPAVPGGIECDMFRQGAIFACGVVLTLVGVADRPQGRVYSLQTLIQRAVERVSRAVMQMEPEQPLSHGVFVFLDEWRDLRFDADVHFGLVLAAARGLLPIVDNNVAVERLRRTRQQDGCVHACKAER